MTCRPVLWPAHSLAAGPVKAAYQELDAIVAVVNDEPITAYDVRQRLNLIIRSSSLQDTPEVRKELAPGDPRPSHPAPSRGLKVVG